jgi:8-oxo-dGTP diphosphatase
VREVAEESGLDVRLGPPLGVQQYQVCNGGLKLKTVHWWAGRPVGGDDVGSYAANDEIDAVEWVPLDKAAARLTYDRDRDTLAQLEQVRKKSAPLVVLRHAKAVSRRSWDGKEPERPLTDEGAVQAERLVPVLCAYGVEHVLSSSSRRCWSTLAPFADVTGVDLEVTRGLTEERSSPRKVESRVHRLLDKAEPAVLCTHRPVLGYVFQALGVRPVKLEAAEMLVVHHRKGRVVAVEHHAC